MSTFQKFLDTMGFSRYAWFRRWCGGHWELWYIDVIHSEKWLIVDRCIYKSEDPHRDRPPLGRGKPTCENYL